MIRGKPVALLPLQMLLYFDTIYSWAYVLLQLALFVYRGYTLNYTILIIGFEVFGVFLLTAIQMLRLFVGNT